MMARSKKATVYNIIFIIAIALILIPQTRHPIQVFINKGIVLLIKPSTIDDDERQAVSSYNWKLMDSSGVAYDFSASKGKVILINFWATWCPPCVAEMPSLEALYQNYKDHKDVEFLFVSNEDPSVIKRFMSKKAYSFPVYQSLTKYPSEFDVTSIPRTFLIDKNGNIVIDKTGPADWNNDAVINTIEDLLKAF